MGKPEYLPVRGSGGGGSSSGDNRFREAPDSLLVDQYAEVADLICEGPIKGWVHDDPFRDTYLDGTPVKNADGSFNFSDVQIAAMWGTVDQPPPAGFNPPASEYAVGVEVRADRPVVREIADPRITALRVSLSVPQLSRQSDSSNELSGARVEFAIDMAVAGGAWQQIAVDAFDGKTMSGYSRSYRIPADGAGPWRVRIRRLTPDAGSSLVADKIYWTTVSTLIERRFSYPYSCVIYTRVKAREFSSIPSRQYLLDLQMVQVPQNYDTATRSYATTGPGTSGGVWDGSFKTAWTNNPAWIFYDLVTTRRYGLGDYVTPGMLNRFELYQIAKYCDELVPDGFGGQEPRFVCNVFFRERQDAIKLLVYLAGSFNAMAFFAHGGVLVSQDIPRAPVRVFNQANVQDGEFSYVGTARRARHTVALVKWRDPYNQGRECVEPVFFREAIKRFGVEEVEIEAVGCTSRGQAHRAGMHLLLSEWYAAEAVSFVTGLDSLGVMPGDVIGTEDPGRNGDRRGGRLLGATASTLQLDAPVTLTPGRTYTVTATLPSLEVETRAVAWAGSSPIEVSELTLVVPLSAVPLVMSVWLLASDDMPTELWRVMGLKELDDGAKVEVTALQHYPGLFAAVDNNTRLDPRPVNTGRNRPGQVTNVVATTSLVSYNGVSYGVRVTISWKAGRNTSRFSIRYKLAGGNWITTSSALPGIDLDNVPNGELQLEIVPLNALGLAGNTTTFTYDVLNNADIGAVTGLMLADGGFEFHTADAVFVWDEFDGADYYEVRVLDGAYVVHETTVVDATFTFSRELNLATGGPRRAFTFGVRAVRPDGRSQTEMAIAVTNPAPEAPTLSLTVGVGAVTVAVAAPTPVDLRGLTVWLSTDPISSTPGTATYSGVGLVWSRYGLSSGVPHYLRASVYDDLGGGAISSQLTFMPLATGGVEQVEDATTITAPHGSDAPGGETFRVVFSQHNGRMYLWRPSLIPARYVAAVSAEEIEGVLEGHQIAQLDGASAIVPGTLTAAQIAASYTSTVALQARNAVIDYAAVNSLSALSANLGGMVAGTITLTATGWNYIRTDSKWWGDSVNGWITASRGDNNSYFQEFRASHGSALVLERKGGGPDLGSLSYLLYVVDYAGVRRLHIEPSTGTFVMRGHIEAVSGTFSGELQAATGHFTGTLSANSIWTHNLNGEAVNKVRSAFSGGNAVSVVISLPIESPVTALGNLAVPSFGYAQWLVLRSLDTGAEYNLSVQSVGSGTTCCMPWAGTLAPGNYEFIVGTNGPGSNAFVQVVAPMR